MNEHVTPFLRWAGGKRWLAEELAPFFSICNGTYYEPFLGSASMFFAARPEIAVLSDINPELINLYEVIRRNPSGLRKRLSKLVVTSDNYYYIRGSIRTRKLEAAVRTLFLNKTGFNGLYRVNKRGEFNVPFGDRSTTAFLKTDIIEKASFSLKNVAILNTDFEPIIDQSVDGDMIYCDPAYTVKHNNNGFLRYNESVFSWADQSRLRDSCVRAARRGVKIIISNAYHSSVADLYRPYRPLCVARRSAIGEKGSRGQVTESIFVLSECSSDRQKVKELLSRIIL